MDISLVTAMSRTAFGAVVLRPHESTSARREPRNASHSGAEREDKQPRMALPVVASWYIAPDFGGHRTRQRMWTITELKRLVGRSAYVTSRPVLVSRGEPGPGI